ncbi:MAG: MBL fold metallo-hydrolase [Crenarchaeota archaeon]|nr:MBL fold metallo-hydrolase [Thermoproteota archaeon]
MKATVLVDNNTFIDRYYVAEPALSILLEYSEKKVLFDAGYSDAFLRNADKMGLDLLDLDSIVLSHGHIDHTGGLAFLIQRLSEATTENRAVNTPNLIGHPFCLYPRPTPPLHDVGSLISEDRARLHFKVHWSKEPFWLTDKLVFLGEIPRKFAFEGKNPYPSTIIMPDGSKKPDLLLDDSALVYKSQKGLVIFAGCSHSGICNTIEYAKEVCQEKRIVDILGGLHLLKPSPEQLVGTCNFMKSVNPTAVHACHCTSLASLVALASTCSIKGAGVGLQLEYK